MDSIDLKENIGIKGRIVLREHPAGTVEWMQNLLAHRTKQSQDAVRRIIKTGRIAAKTDNLIMVSASHGLDLIVQRLCSVNTYSLNISYGEIGTSATAVTTADTALNSPSARASMALASDVGSNQAQIQFFFTDGSLANTTYREFGTFVDGTSTIGTGQLFNHAVFTVAYTKAAGTDITVEVDFSLA